MRAGVKQGDASIDINSTRIFEAWNLMGGEINWAALPTIAELVGAPDIELFIRGLVQLRDHLRQEADDEAEAQRRRMGRA